MPHHFRRRSDRTIGTESSCFASLAAMSCSSESEAPPREAKVSGRVRPSRGKTTPSNEYLRARVSTAVESVEGLRRRASKAFASAKGVQANRCGDGIQGGGGGAFLA
eukprot:6179515-Pleurochrysis_carterae.AAC.7